MPRFSLTEALQRGWISPAEAKKKQPIPIRDVLSCGERVSNKAKNKDAEGQEQAQLVQWFEQAYPQYQGLLLHIPNGGFRKNAFEGWRLKQQGVRAGVSDLFLPVAAGGFYGFWIEFKATPPFDAKASKPQLDWIDKMQKQGYQAKLCKGFDQGKECLARYVDQ